MNGRGIAVFTSSAVCWLLSPAFARRVKHPLHKIMKVSLEERTPGDWSKLLLITTHKKGDRLVAITLTCILRIVFCRIILNKVQEQIEIFSSDNQVFFRPGSRAVDAIFIIRQIMERQENIMSPFISSSLTSKQPLVRCGEKHCGGCWRWLEWVKILLTSSGYYTLYTGTRNVP